MASQEPTKNAKRRLRAPAPTVRQQAEKAAAKPEQPNKRGPVRRTVAKAGKPFGPVGRLLYKIFNRQPFRFIGKILRFIGRLLLPKFIRGAFAELRQVEWPTRKQSRQLTGAVLLFAVIFGVSIAVVDYGLDKLFKAILLK